MIKSLDFTCVPVFKVYQCIVLLSLLTTDQWRIPETFDALVVFSRKLYLK